MPSVPVVCQIVTLYVNLSLLPFSPISGRVVQYLHPLLNHSRSNAPPHPCLARVHLARSEPSNPRAGTRPIIHSPAPPNPPTVHIPRPYLDLDSLLRCPTHATPTTSTYCAILSHITFTNSRSNNQVPILCSLLYCNITT